MAAHDEIGSMSVDIFLTDCDIEIIEIEVNTRDRVLKPAKIKNLLLSKNSFSISRNDYFFKYYLGYIELSD